MKRIDVYAHYMVSDAGCWNWLGAIDCYGYGKHTNNRKAHRMFYEHFRGPIPQNLCVCHACDNRKCVNPDHLFLGTPADNSSDMVKKDRQARGAAVATRKLDEDRVRIILQSDDPCFVLAQRFGVSDTAVSCVRRGKTWKHVPRPEGYSYVPYRAPGSHEKYETRIAAHAGVFIPMERAA